MREIADRIKEYIKKQRAKAIIKGKSIRQDGYSNMLNKYGTMQDNSESYEFQPEDVIPDMEMTTLYEGNGLFTKIIDRPAEEAVKHGYDINYGDKSVAKYVEDRMDELELEDKFATAEKWARLYGGAIIVMLVDDGRGLEDPLCWDVVKSIDELRVFERSIVQPDYTSLFRYEDDFTDSNRPYGQPEFYGVYSVYGSFRVHYTRCLLFKNGRLPERTTNLLYRFWGIPEYMKIKRALRENITAHSDGVKLLERSVQAIYKMKDLAQKLATDKGEDDVIQRMQVIDMARGILNSLVIDAEGEDYDFKTLQMAGVKDILDSTCNMLSAVTDIPQTILFGRSPAGQNSTGESDLENYYNMVENIQKQNFKTNSRIVIDLILCEGKRTGKIKKIPTYKVKFAALWSMSEEQQATVDNTNAQTDLTKAQTRQTYIDMQAVDPTEVRKSLIGSDVADIDDVEESEGLDLPASLFDLFAAEQEPEREHDSADAAAVIVVQKGRILAGKRDDTLTLCGPGGKIEEGETPRQAAVREAKEEFFITPLILLPLGINKATSDQYKDTMVYLCTDFSGEALEDGKEMLSTDWYSLDEVYNELLFPPFEESLGMLMDALKVGEVGI